MEEPLERKIIQTEDGSSTIYVPVIDEHYHSVKGALTESEHIFINMGLAKCTKETPTVFEVGFGTGLNAWTTLLAANKGQRKVKYISIELYPVDWDMLAKLHFTEDPLFKSMHDTPWGKTCVITPYFELTKIKGDIYDALMGNTVPNIQMEHADIVYFDAFSPEKQPEMWTEQLFKLLYEYMNPDAILTTYCAKGVVRRTLQAAGFVVERLPGPPNGKREILRATKPKNRRLKTV